MNKPKSKRRIPSTRNDKSVGGRCDKVRQQIEEKIAKYYEERSEEELEEEIAWGKFAVAEFVAIEMDRLKNSNSAPPPARRQRPGRSKPNI
jgi:hypothetical protein